MDPKSRELFRLGILRDLDANNTKFGLEEDGLRAMAVKWGFRPSKEELAKELLYLEGKGLVKRVEKRISPEVTAWQITSDGTDFIAQNE